MRDLDSTPHTQNGPYVIVSRHSGVEGNTCLFNTTCHKLFYNPSPPLPSSTSMNSCKDSEITLVVARSCITGTPIFAHYPIVMWLSDQQPNFVCHLSHVLSATDSHNLKLTFGQYPAIHTNYIIPHCTTI